MTLFSKTCLGGGDFLYFIVIALYFISSIYYSEMYACYISAGHLAVRQHSTTEYLPFMLHSRSPHGLLPKFPSFSLCRLGPANFYSHIHGQLQ